MKKLAWILWLCIPLRLAAAPELPVSGPLLTLSPPSGQHYEPDAIALTSGFLTVWQKGQDHVGTEGADLFYRRLDRKGRPLEGPRKLCTRPGSQERPTLARSGDRVLVVWQDFRNGHDWDIYAAQADADGAFSPDCGFPLATGPANAALPVAAAAPRGFLVIWQQTDADGFYRLHAATVEGPGVVRNLGPIRNVAPDAATWHGYTPGWGVGRQPLRKGRRDAHILTGGRAELIAIPRGWLLTWHDESNWGPGKRPGLTRRIARLERRDNRVLATAITAAPSNGLAREEGRFARHGDRVLLVGRSYINRGVSYVAGALLPLQRLEFLHNPNAEPKRFGAGWDASRVFSLFRPALGMEGPVAAAPFAGGFLVAAVGDARAGAPHARRILGNLIDREGRRLLADGDWPVLHQGEALPSRPVLAGRGKTALLVFEQRRGADRLIQARLIRGAVP